MGRGPRDVPALWVLVMATIGFRAPTAISAALWALAFFVAMCFAYYTWAVLVLGFGRGNELYAWLVLAVTAVPLLSASAWWATRRRGVLPGIVIGSLAALVLASGAAWRVGLHFAGHLPSHATRPVQAAVEVGMVLVVLLAFPRHSTTRAWAVAVLLPVAWMVPRLFEATERALRFT